MGGGGEIMAGRRWWWQNYGVPWEKIVGGHGWSWVAARFSNARSKNV